MATTLANRQNQARKLELVRSLEEKRLMSKSRDTLDKRAGGGNKSGSKVKKIVLKIKNIEQKNEAFF